MAIMFEPKSKNTETIDTVSINTNDLPLGQRPEGNEFDKALIKLENTFNLLISRVNALEENFNNLQRTTERNCELIKTIVTFSDKLEWIPREKDAPLVLTPDMEVKDGHK